MKTSLILLLGIALSSFTSPAADSPAKNAALLISYSYIGIEDGYDHPTKSVISIDGVDVLTTEVHLQSEAMTCSIEVPKGNHEVRIDTYAMYEGNWELHTVENGYSIDCNYVLTELFKKRKKYTLTVLYDLDGGVTRLN